MHSGKFVLPALLALAILPSCAAQAQTYTLNFDTDLANNPISGGTLLNTAYVIPGVTFNPTATIYVGGGGVTSQPNFASGSGSDFATSLVINFATLADYVTAFNVTNSSYMLTAYDAANNVLGTDGTSIYGDSTTVTAVGQIAKAVISVDAPFGQYGIDDLSFHINSTSAVPEPGSIALLCGVGVSGLVALRRRRK